ncbi:hypothetical protein B0H13DRAFT_1995369 [Mycena leptocephala]|nr:hypothetical protein B0H13DRAFT_1995369 [Mycena leptocephala]
MWRFQHRFSTPNSRLFLDLRTLQFASLLSSARAAHRVPERYIESVRSLHRLLICQATHGSQGRQQRSIWAVTIASQAAGPHSHFTANRTYLYTYASMSSPSELLIPMCRPPTAHP